MPGRRDGAGPRLARPARALDRLVGNPSSVKGLVPGYPAAMGSAGGEGGARGGGGPRARPRAQAFCAGGTFAHYAGQGAEIMVVWATRGQAGQIRDAAVGNRRTIAAVREAELRRACEGLGITRVRCLDYVDGTLADAEFSALVDEVAEVLCEFRPDIVITFGPDGGYGHPDHVTISAATTAACQRTAAS